MIQFHKLSKLSLLVLSISILSACGSEDKNDVSSSSSDHPPFSWSKVAVTNGFGPSGDITENEPDFTWPAVTGATEYNFGHGFTTSPSAWKEYTVSATEAGCTTGTVCSYKPTNHTFDISDQKVWWVRGRVNGQLQDWSDAHVFRLVTTLPPTASYVPLGNTNTATPIFSWPQVNTTTQYELGIEAQTATGWESYTINANCQASSCSYTPTYNYTVNTPLTWWVRPVAGIWSNGVDFTITNNGSTDTQAPTDPSNVIEVSSTASSASIQWDSSTDNFAVTGYRIYRNGQETGTTSGLTYTDTALSASTLYTYTVRAFDAAQNLSSDSNSLAVTTESAGNPTNTLFNWTPIANAASYTFGIERSGGTDWQEYIRTADEYNCQTGTCSFTPPNYSLNVGDSVYWWVKPLNGDWSAATFVTVTGTIVDTQAPSTPTNLVSDSTSSNSVALSWNASTDNTAVTGYKIFRDGAQLSTSTDANFTDNSASPSTTYSYTISAYDTATNESALSASLSVTTPPVIQLGGVIINEALAGNTTTNMDTDFYAFSDWIELYNTSNQAIDISGYYLSDDPTKPTDWEVPAGTTIPAQGYLLIWADKEDIKANEIHTNFALSSKGETLTLADTSGTVINTFIFDKLESNVSAGLSGSNVLYMQPTPAAQNSTAFTTGDQSKAPTFSNIAGFYSASLNLELSQENAGSIFYTTDGSEPTSSSTIYTTALTLTETTVVKAISIENGSLPSTVETNTFFIGHQSNLPVVSLSMENSHLFDDTIGIYTEGTNGLLTPPWCKGILANYQQDWDRPTFVEYFDENKDRALAFGSDVAITGECSRTKLKKSFGFELDGKHGTKSLSYKLYPGKDLGKIKDFKIRTANTGYRVGDILGAELIEEGGLDVDYQAYRAIQMFMNGEYWGVYSIREKKSSDYLESNYDGLGDVDIIKAYELKKGDFDDHYAFNYFLTSTDLSTDANYQEALTYFDEASYIDYMAFMLYNGNKDWIGGNHRNWKEKVAGAKWRWIVDDIDWGFVSTLDYAGEGYAVNTNHFEKLKNTVSGTNVHLLFNGLMLNDTFKTKFKTRFNELLSTVFTEAFLMPIVDRIDDERKDYMHLEKFKGMPADDYVASYANYMENDIRNFIRVRTAIVQQQLDAAIPN